MKRLSLTLFLLAGAAGFAMGNGHEISRPEALIEEGEALLAQERFDEALPLFESALSLNSSAVRARLGRGRCHIWSGQYQEARADFAAAARAGKQNAEVLLWTGISEAILEHPEEALALFNRAIDLDPGNPMAYLQRGILVSATAPEAALKDLSKVIELDSSSALGYMNRGYVHACLHQGEAAEDDYLKSISLDPQNSQARFNLADLYREHEIWPDAAEQYRVGLRLKPDAFAGYLNLGICYDNLGYLLAAQKAYAAFADMAPPGYGTYVRKALARVDEIDRQIWTPGPYMGSGQGGGWGSDESARQDARDAVRRYQSQMGGGY